MSLRAIVVDDEPLARDELTFLLRQCERVEVVGEAHGPAEARRLCDDAHPEVAFIDMRMPGLDGIALADLLRREHPDLEVVMVSGSDDGALRGFEAQVSDYLLKPVRLERLRRSIERLSAPQEEGLGGSSPLERFAVRRRGAYVVVDIDDVVCFEAKDELLWAVTETDRFPLDTRLSSLARRLDPSVFFQSHRSCIVRLDRIRVIEPFGARSFRLVLDHPEAIKLPLSRDRASKLREHIPFSR